MLSSEILQMLCGGAAGGIIGGLVAKSLIAKGFVVIGAGVASKFLVKLRIAKPIAVDAAPFVVTVVGGVLVGLVVYGTFRYFWKNDR